MKRITTESSEDVVPSWSNDGKWIYFASNRTGTLQIWKSPSSGGAARQVTRQGGFATGNPRTGNMCTTRKGERYQVFGACRSKAGRRSRCLGG